MALPACTHACRHIYIDAARYTHSFIRACLQAYIHEWPCFHACCNVYKRAYERKHIHVCMHAYIRAYMYACAHKYTYTHLHARARMYVHAYACRCACVRACTLTHVHACMAWHACMHTFARVRSQSIIPGEWCQPAGPYGDRGRHRRVPATRLASRLRSTSQGRLTGRAVPTRTCFWLPVCLLRCGCHTRAGLCSLSARMSHNKKIEKTRPNLVTGAASLAVVAQFWCGTQGWGSAAGTKFLVHVLVCTSKCFPPPGLLFGDAHRSRQ